MENDPLLHQKYRNLHTQQETDNKKWDFVWSNLKVELKLPLQHKERGVTDSHQIVEDFLKFDSDGTIIPLGSRGVIKTKLDVDFDVLQEFYFYCDLQRYLSFPQNVASHVKLTLSRAGLYFIDNKIKCCWCYKEIHEIEDDILKKILHQNCVLRRSKTYLDINVLKHLDFTFEGSRIFTLTELGKTHVEAKKLPGIYNTLRTDFEFYCVHCNKFLGPTDLSPFTHFCEAKPFEKPSREDTNNYESKVSLGEEKPEDNGDLNFDKYQIIDQVQHLEFDQSNSIHRGILTLQQWTKTSQCCSPDMKSNQGTEVLSPYGMKIYSMYGKTYTKCNSCNFTTFHLNSIPHSFKHHAYQNINCKNLAKWKNGIWRKIVLRDFHFYFTLQENEIQCFNCDFTTDITNFKSVTEIVKSHQIYNRSCYDKFLTFNVSTSIQNVFFYNGYILESNESYLCYYCQSSTNFETVNKQLLESARFYGCRLNSYCSREHFLKFHKIVENKGFLILNQSKLIQCIYCNGIETYSINFDLIEHIKKHSECQTLRRDYKLNMEDILKLSKFGIYFRESKNCFTSFNNDSLILKNVEEILNLNFSNEEFKEVIYSRTYFESIRLFLILNYNWHYPISFDFAYLMAKMGYIPIEENRQKFVCVFCGTRDTEQNLLGKYYEPTKDFKITHRRGHERVEDIINVTIRKNEDFSTKSFQKYQELWLELSCALEYALTSKEVEVGFTDKILHVHPKNFIKSFVSVILALILYLLDVGSDFNVGFGFLNESSFLRAIAVLFPVYLSSWVTSGIFKKDYRILLDANKCATEKIHTVLSKLFINFDTTFKNNRKKSIAQFVYFSAIFLTASAPAMDLLFCIRLMWPMFFNMSTKWVYTAMTTSFSTASPLWELNLLIYFEEVAGSNKRNEIFMETMPQTFFQLLFLQQDLLNTPVFAAPAELRMRFFSLLLSYASFAKAMYSIVTDKKNVTYFNPKMMASMDPVPSYYVEDPPTGMWAYVRIIWHICIPMSRVLMLLILALTCPWFVIPLIIIIKFVTITLTIRRRWSWDIPTYEELSLSWIFTFVPLSKRGLLFNFHLFYILEYVCEFVLFLVFVYLTRLHLINVYFIEIIIITVLFLLGMTAFLVYLIRAKRILDK